jgi:2-keto-4-pentenoate hydratase
MPLSAGDKLGPYETLAPIGAGGMGAGQIITAGSFGGVLEARVGAPLRMTFDGLDALSVQFVSS